MMGGVQRSERDKQKAAFGFLMRDKDGNALQKPERLPRPPICYQRDAVGRIVMNDGCDRRHMYWNMMDYRPDADTMKERDLSRMLCKAWIWDILDLGEEFEFVPRFVDQVLDEFAKIKSGKLRFAEMTSEEQMKLLMRLLEDVEREETEPACRTAYVYMAEMLAQILVIDRFPGVDFVSGGVNDCRPRPDKTYLYPLFYLSETCGGPGAFYPLMAEGRLQDYTWGVMSMNAWVKVILEKALCKMLPHEEAQEGCVYSFFGTQSSMEAWQTHLTRLYFRVVGAAFCVASYDDKMKHLVVNGLTYKSMHGNALYHGRNPILRVLDMDEDEVPTWAMTSHFDTKKAMKLEEFVGPWVAEPVSYTHLTLPTKRIV